MDWNREQGLGEKVMAGWDRERGEMAKEEARMKDPKDGWLERSLASARAEVATWPAWKKRAMRVLPEVQEDEMTKEGAEDLLREVGRDRRDLDLTLRVVEGALANVRFLDEHAPRAPLRPSYRGSLGQAALFLRKAAEALEEAKGFLPDE